MGIIHTLYAGIQKRLPNKLKGFVTYSLYQTGIKPTINKNTQSIYDKGVVVISADFEMAWAFRVSKTVKNATERGLIERKNVPIILDLLEKNNIPITWATVGHLFLEKCKKDDKTGLPHAELLRPSYFENRNWLFNKGDWYDGDPCTDYKDDPAWYAPDLIDLIIKSKVKHEIGCHTFSHSDFTYENCTPELATVELEKCIELANKKGIKLNSIVFPGGTYGNYETVKKHGFITYRKKSHYDIDNPWLDKNKLVVLPTTYGMDISDHNWSATKMIKIGKTFIDKCIKYKKIAHFWFHPSMDTWYLKHVFPEILSYINQKQKEEKLKVMTMEQVAKHFKELINK